MSININMAFYKATVLSMSIRGGKLEALTTYDKREKWLNAFYMRNLRRILDITWQEKTPNAVVLSKAKHFNSAQAKAS